MSVARRKTILLVDDDPFDVRIFTRTLEKLGLEIPVTVAGDGVDALTTLRGTGDRAPLGRPHLVLLDLNMPRMNGHEFLKALRADPHLHDTVVIVVTTSDAAPDCRRAYDRNVAGYLLKSNRQEEFTSSVAMLSDYLDKVRLPA